jgi:HEAT repeat protein
MENMRTNAYTPFITLTYISADVETGDGTKRIGAFVTRGKTPVWSFEEIIDPTFNQPLGLGIQEFASKFANAVYGFRASDETVKALIEKVNGARTPNTFLDVYALGFTNNPAALDTLIGLTKDSQEYVRQAAIASLGNLGATTQLGMLKAIYQDASVAWQDRCIALKSIADLGTDESKAFITDEAKRLAGNSSKETQVMSRILALYL